MTYSYYLSTQPFTFTPRPLSQYNPSPQPLSMSHHYLMHNETLIRDTGVFELQYTPETIYYRDGELRQIAGVVSPALRGASPTNANLRGPPGTGKTTCVRRIFSELEETTHHVVPIFINCNCSNTACRVFAAIFERLLGHQAPKSGIHLQLLVDPIAKELIKRKAVLIVCLDDANCLCHHGQLEMVIRSLIRMYENYPGVKTGVITTISDHAFFSLMVLDPAVISVWQPEEIPFTYYQQEQVRTILQDRIRMGVYPGVVPSAILNRITTLTVEECDLRMGIALLKKSVLIAERDARTQVTDDDVTRAFKTARSAYLTHLRESLKPNEERLLSHIVKMKREHPGVPLISGPLFDSFEATQDISYSGFHGWLTHLCDLRFIDLRQRAHIGNSREVILLIDSGE